MEKIQNVYTISITEAELATIKMTVKCSISNYKKAIDEQYKLSNDSNEETAEEARWCIRNNTRKLAELEKIARELDEIEL